MSQGELIMLLVHLGVAGFTWFSMLRPFTTVSPLRESRGTGAGVVLGMGLFITVGMVAALQAWAASDVRGTIYLPWYVLMGLAWVGGAIQFLLPWTGLSLRDDGAERRNPAALVAIAGAMLGLALAFTGGNFGDGPGWWVVAVCGVLSMGGLLLAWVVSAVISGAAYRITVGRDRAVAWRTAGLLVGAGLVLGRAVAGDWVSGPATWRDFVELGWVVLPAAVVEGVLTRVETPGRDWMLMGALPALVYLGLATAYVVEIGWW
ncbi:MAG: hypothetical protein AAF333_17935 [Planctomycetota bacterium]